MKIIESIYKDIPAIQIETDGIAALFLPAYGGKCASIKDKKTGREFLSQVPGVQYKKLSYDGNYVDSECSGFDDMFPSIDACYYDHYPWQGVRIPDHGEVCGLQWNYEIKNATLYMWTYSPRFGYRFEKTIEENGDGISVNYRVVNNTQFPLDFVYAAHCMIAAEPGGRIILPGVSDGEKGTVSFSSEGRRGRYGTPFVWNGDAGKTPDLVKAKNGTFTAAETFKFFFDDPQTKGCCEYRYADGISISMQYSAEKLPYLGIWINWYDFHNLCNVAFEPSSGSFDRPDAARIRGQYSTLQPFGQYEWNIRFNVRSKS